MMKLRSFVISSLTLGLSLFLLASKPALQQVVPTTSDCFECHGERDFATVDSTGQEISLYVDAQVYRTSVHRELSCVDCHTDISEIPHKEELAPVECGMCHDLVAERFDRSSHGAAHRRGDPDAPTCAKCHGEHDILPKADPASRTSRINATNICLGCHVDEEVTKRHEELPSPETIRAYRNSVHGQGIFDQGLIVSAECIDCHRAHLVLPASDPEANLFKTNVPKVCGNCHERIEKEYEASVHGEAVRSGVLDAPVCTDCHGEHDILAPSEEASAVSPRNVPKTCSACHDDVALTGKYQLPGRRYETYLDSFHGVALKYGETVVANCASCHGVHNILPSSDPRSSVHPSNLRKTCGQCHPTIGDKAALAKVHVEAKPTSSRGKYIVRTFYTWFISILVGLFVLYIAIETVGKLRYHRSRRAS